MLKEDAFTYPYKQEMKWYRASAYVEDLMEGVKVLIVNLEEAPRRPGVRVSRHNDNPGAYTLCDYWALSSVKELPRCEPTYFAQG